MIPYCSDILVSCDNALGSIRKATDQCLVS